MVRFTALATTALIATLPFVSADLQRRQSGNSSGSGSDSDSSKKDSHSSGHRSHTHHHHTGTASSSGTRATRALAQAAASDAGLPASVSSLIATITTGVPTSTPSFALSTTYTAGAQNTLIDGAPALPAQTAARPADFPTLDKVPPSDSQQAKAWLAQYDLSDVPNIAQTTNQAACSSNPDNLKNAEANHWWTCGGYTTKDDITECPDENTWGVSYDDGPSPYTPKLLDYFEKNGDIKSTFFVVGSRAISRPDILQYQYMKGHQLSVHTWSHTALTTQSNEQILLELAWTKEVIRRITGVTPNTMRPPYGDIDDRVRAICKKLGLTPIIWTSVSKTESFDTNDWKLQSGQVTVADSVAKFDDILSKGPTLGHGYIVLAHDLYQQSVDLAVSVVLPMAQSMNPAQKLQPIITCLKQPLGNAYIETNTNSSSAKPNQTGTLKSESGSGSGSSGAESLATTSKLLPVVALVGGISMGAALLL
ncbi:unnamed protein product [Sympodiomycopsis kandeliae]